MLAIIINSKILQINLSNASNYDLDALIMVYKQCVAQYNMLNNTKIKVEDCYYY